MQGTRFLSNETLWAALRATAGQAKTVQAAIAFVGMGGAKLLPLKRGDTLLVDMSLGTVKRGGTDPKAVRTPMRRGVQVFTRAGLHTKCLLAGNTLIAGSPGTVGDRTFC
ncbi:MAG: hypothetical protein WCK05_15795 [Planctomycetota bacterium]